MNEILLNSSVTTLIATSDNSTLSDLALFLDGNFATENVTFTRVGSSNVWAVAFTPLSTGVYSIYGFGKIQEKLLCVTKKTSDYIKNLEDEALGSWSWDKTLGVLTMYRQNGSQLAVFDVADTSGQASRERTA